MYFPPVFVLGVWFVQTKSVHSRNDNITTISLNQLPENLAFVTYTTFTLSCVNTTQQSCNRPTNTHTHKEDGSIFILASQRPSTNLCPKCIYLLNVSCFSALPTVEQIIKKKKIKKTLTLWSMGMSLAYWGRFMSIFCFGKSLFFFHVARVDFILTISGKKKEYILDRSAVSLSLTPMV